MKILLLVDIQNDFCPNGALAVCGSENIIPIANALMRSGQFDHVIASKDWHPANHMSFEELWPVHCVQHSLGAEFHPALLSERIDHIVYKGEKQEYDSYSAFRDNEKTSETGLRPYLLNLATEQGICLEEIELTICGLATDYCVKFTALDAREFGYPVDLIIDGCRAVNISPGDEVAALREMTKAGVNIIESREVLQERPRAVERSRNHSISLSA